MPNPPAPARSSILAAMDSRSRQIFDEIVRAYLETGEPVGSRTISRRGVALSPASIRNVMSDLADFGLLDSPHTSSGRLPTQTGLRVFVDGLMEVNQLRLDARDKRRIQSGLAHLVGADAEEMLGEASELLSGLAGGAGLVESPTRDAPIKHIEFVSISRDQALAIMVYADDDVENRIVKVPDGLMASTLVEASNYLNARMKGKSLSEATEVVRRELADNKAALDAIASRLVQDGLAQWSGEDPMRGRSLIVRGRENLIDDAGAAEDFNRVRQLFKDLDRTENLLHVLDGAREAGGVRLFIGSENPLFSLSGSSVVVAPYMNAERRIVGALGVIGPTRLDYARVIPLVDYTAHVVGQLLEGRSVRRGKDDR